MTIFQWLNLSDAGEPSLEKKSEPDQKNIVISYNINQFIFFPLYFFPVFARDERAMRREPANIAASPMLMTMRSKGFLFMMI